MTVTGFCYTSCAVVVGRTVSSGLSRVTDTCDCDRVLLHVVSGCSREDGVQRFEACD